MPIIAKTKDQDTGQTQSEPSVPIGHPGLVSAPQIERVQSTWQQVQPIAEQVAALFYNKLFEIDPSLKALFKTEMGGQGKKLVEMMTAAVNGLDHLETLIPAVQALGERHAGYGVEAHHYDTVATALLWTLEQGLGEAFTEEVKQAWVAVYTVLADTMKRAAGGE